MHLQNNIQKKENLPYLIWSLFFSTDEWYIIPLVVLYSQLKVDAYYLLSTMIQSIVVHLNANKWVHLLTERKFYKVLT